MGVCSNRVSCPHFSHLLVFKATDFLRTASGRVSLSADYWFGRLKTIKSFSDASHNALVDCSYVKCFIIRDEASQRIQALSDKIDKDNQQHNMEMKELVRLIDHERKLKQFMKIKAAERDEDPQLTAWKVNEGLNLTFLFRI